jgi:hypothetical protein
MAQSVSPEFKPEYPTKKGGGGGHIQEREGKRKKLKR